MCENNILSSAMKKKIMEGKNENLIYEQLLCKKKLQCGVRLVGNSNA